MFASLLYGLLLLNPEQAMTPDTKPQKVIPAVGKTNPAGLL